MRALVTRAWLYGLGLLGVMGGVAAGCSAEPGDTGTRAALGDTDAGVALQHSLDAVGIAKALATRDSKLERTMGKNPAVSLRLHGGMFLPAKVEEGLARSIGFSVSERATGPSTFYPIDQTSNALELRLDGARDVKAELND